MSSSQCKSPWVRMSSPARSWSLRTVGQGVLELLAEAHVHHAGVQRPAPHAHVEPARARPGTGDGARKNGIGGDGEHEPLGNPPSRFSQASHPSAESGGWFWWSAPEDLRTPVNFAFRRPRRCFSAAERRQEEGHRSADRWPFSPKQTWLRPGCAGYGTLTTR